MGRSYLHLYDACIMCLYLPREVIIDECTHIAYTFIETVLNNNYICSLERLLRDKIERSSVASHG